MIPIAKYTLGDLVWYEDLLLLNLSSMPTTSPIGFIIGIESFFELSNNKSYRELKIVDTAFESAFIRMERIINPNYIIISKWEHERQKLVQKDPYIYCIYWNSYNSCFFYNAYEMKDIIPFKKAIKS